MLLLHTRPHEQRPQVIGALLTPGRKGLHVSAISHNLSVIKRMDRQLVLAWDARRLRRDLMACQFDLGRTPVLDLRQLVQGEGLRILLSREQAPRTGAEAQNYTPALLEQAWTQDFNTRGLKRQWPGVQLELSGTAAELERELGELIILTRALMIRTDAHGARGLSSNKPNLNTGSLKNAEQRGERGKAGRLTAPSDTAAVHAATESERPPQAAKRPPQAAKRDDQSR